MDLYGIYGKYTQEACPLYNDEIRKHVLKVAPAIAKKTQKYKVSILHQFHSGLEHTLLWIVEADNAHLIEDVMSRMVGRFNTLKIVPLMTFEDVVERCKKIEEGFFFPDIA